MYLAFCFRYGGLASSFNSIYGIYENHKTNILALFAIWQNLSPSFSYENFYLQHKLGTIRRNCLEK